MTLFRRQPMLCREAVEAVTAYLEDAMPRRDRARFEAHLAACPHCSAYLEQIRETIALTGALEPETLSDEARRDLERVFQAWVAEAP
jgi:anti-sigma factor RsiW